MEIKDIIAKKKNEEKLGWDFCRHPNHNPPMHLYIPAGKSHEHTCPSCGNRQVVHGTKVHL